MLHPAVWAWGALFTGLMAFGQLTVLVDYLSGLWSSALRLRGEDVSAGWMLIAGSGLYVLLVVSVMVCSAILLMRTIKVNYRSDSAVDREWSEWAFMSVDGYLLAAVGTILVVWPNKYLAMVSQLICVPLVELGSAGTGLAQGDLAMLDVAVMLAAWAPLLMSLVPLGAIAVLLGVPVWLRRRYLGDAPGAPDGDGAR
jgi:hypothetical protein